MLTPSRLPVNFGSRHTPVLIAYTYQNPNKRTPRLLISLKSGHPPPGPCYELPYISFANLSNVLNRSFFLPKTFTCLTPFQLKTRPT